MGLNANKFVECQVGHLGRKTQYETQELERNCMFFRCNFNFVTRKQSNVSLMKSKDIKLKKGSANCPEKTTCPTRKHLLQTWMGRVRGAHSGFATETHRKLLKAKSVRRLCTNRTYLHASCAICCSCPC